MNTFTNQPPPPPPPRAPQEKSPAEKWGIAAFLFLVFLILLIQQSNHGFETMSGLAFLVLLSYGMYAFLRFKQQKPYRKKVFAYAGLAFALGLVGDMMTQDPTVALEKEFEEKLNKQIEQTKKEAEQSFEKESKKLIAAHDTLEQQIKKLEENLEETTQKQEALEEEKKNLEEKIASINQENDSQTQQAVSAPTSESTSQQAPPAPKQQEHVHYKNCSEVRAAGKAPIYRGQPGYASHLDRDGDGIACE